MEQEQNVVWYDLKVKYGLSDGTLYKKCILTDGNLAFMTMLQTLQKFSEKQKEGTLESLNISLKKTIPELLS